MKFWHHLPLVRNYVAALSRVSALETAFTIMLENPRYVASDAAGFNGQQHRKRIFRELVEACTFERLIETGTYIGDTTAFMATTTGLPVHTCESNHTFQALARSRLAGITGIHFHTGDSRQCLRALLSDPSNRDWLQRPLFVYLDAHWHADLPLVEEIALIASYAKDFVIMIDDFKVEGDPGYGYDNYGRGKSLELSTIRPAIDRFSLVAYFPSLHQPPSQEGAVVPSCSVPRDLLPPAWTRCPHCARPEVATTTDAPKLSVQPMSRPKKQVLIRPLWDMGLNNRLFDTIYPWSLTCWREAAAALGIALDGWDTMPLEKADCIWLLDLPDRKADFLSARKRARPGTPFVLQVMETPVGRPHNFMPENQALCDALVTYQQGPLSHPNAHRYRLPHSLSFTGIPVPYAQRKCSIMVNSNRVEGYFSPRHPGLTGLPGIGRNFSGWKMPAWSWINPARGELYSWRRKLAHTAADKGPDLLTIIGPKWRGERISWSSLFPHPVHPCCIADGTDKKLEVISGFRFCISVENYRGTLDYISEKILDPIVAGSVPVYLGDENIAQTVPAAAFVDVRNFRSQRELLLYLETCPRAEWEAMHAAGQAFITSEKAQAFSTESFVTQMNDVLLKVLGLSR